MFKIHREEPEARLEITPLNDVIFLVLTFFIYAMVLMVRIDLLDVPLETYSNAEPAEPIPAIALTIALDGQLFMGTESIDAEEMLPRLEDALQQDDETMIYLVMAAGEGTVDRGPILTSLWNRLQRAQMDIHFVGAPSAQ